MTGVPYTFANATTSIPLSQLDSNFNTTLTIGSTSVGLGNTTSSLANVTFTGTTTLPGSGAISSAGLLGIGMTPSNILDITQNQNADSVVAIKNTNASGAATSTFYAYNGTHGFNVGMLGTGYTTNGILIADRGYMNCTSGVSIGSGSDIRFSVSGLTEKARFDSTNGGFFVGVTAATSLNGGGANAKMAVQGNYSGASVAAFENTNNAGALNSAAASFSNFNTGSAIITFWYGSLQGYITSNGSGSVSLNNSSSETLKSDVVPIEPSFAINALRGWRGYSFTRKDTGLKDFGFIVERFDTAATELGLDAHKLGYIHKGDDPSEYGMDYSKPMPFVVAAMLDHEDRIAALEARVAELEAKVTA
jgi:hypothetical protein